MRKESTPHLMELSFGDASAVHDESEGFEAGGPVELDEQLPDHGGQIPDYLLSM